MEPVCYHRVNITGKTVGRFHLADQVGRQGSKVLRARVPMRETVRVWRHRQATAMRRAAPKTMAVALCAIRCTSHIRGASRLRTSARSISAGPTARAEALAFAVSAEATHTALESAAAVGFAVG